MLQEELDDSVHTEFTNGAAYSSHWRNDTKRPMRSIVLSGQAVR